MTLPRLRSTVGLRLLGSLCGIAFLATALALLLQDQTLGADLERAARARLERSARAVELLLSRHVEAVRQRYAAISGTPQLRANLETRHVPTLTRYAEQLRARQGAAAIAFLDGEGALAAQAGDAELVEAFLASWGGRPGALVLALGGRGYAASALPLTTGERLVGHLIAAESIAAETIDDWSTLCGARVAFAPAGEQAAPIQRVVREIGDLELRVEGSLDAEHAALGNARRRLIAAGGVALALAFLASFLLSRGLVRPLLSIQRAAERIGRGDLAVRLGSTRRDELGDVARAFDWMLERMGRTIDALRRSERRLSRAQQLARLGHFSVDPESGVLHVSETLRKIYGFERDTPPRLGDVLARVHAADRDAVREAFDACARSGTPFQLDHRILGADGAWRVVHSQGELTHQSDSRPAQVEGTAQDITERKAIEEQVRRLAYHDTLTGLGNRHLFRELLDLAIAGARHGKSRPTILCLDVDRFKRINDTMGHSVGDRLLCGVAERLVRSMRAADRRAQREGRESRWVVCRQGGDEFTILLADARHPREAVRVARRVIDELSQPFFLERLEVVVGCSIGIAGWPDDGADADELLRNGDTAMHYAKRRRRNVYELYAPSMNARSYDGLLFENRLRRAVEKEELDLHYQPKVDTATGRLTGFEALLRWSDAELGVVPPSDFVALAEEIGLIETIGRWTLRTAALQIRAWREAGLPPLRVAVNVSGCQVERGGLAEAVAGILEETQLDPAALELEITESTLLADEDAVAATLADLKRLGVRLSLDDFGTGYSSLDYLRRLPFDSLKIDRSFVRPLADGAEDAPLAAAILSMAKALGLHVVAEGVEEEGQRELLHELGCDEIQGHLVSPAIPADSVPALVRQLSRGRVKRRRARSSGGKPRSPRRARARPEIGDGREREGGGRG